MAYPAADPPQLGLPAACLLVLGAGFGSLGLASILQAITGALRLCPRIGRQAARLLISFVFSQPLLLTIPDNLVGEATLTPERKSNFVVCSGNH